jgi:hypothetical protein
LLVGAAACPEPACGELVEPVEGVGACGELACTEFIERAEPVAATAGTAWLPTLVLYVRVISVKSAELTDPS